MSKLWELVMQAVMQNKWRLTQNVGKAVLFHCEVGEFVVRQTCVESCSIINIADLCRRALHFRVYG
jgi:hypothetical protein